MGIEQIKLRNFKAFQDVTISNIPNFCVFVGANGTGKTTLFDVFGFLQDCLTYDVNRALQKRGGFKEVVSRKSNIPNIPIEYESEIHELIGTPMASSPSILIELKMRVKFSIGLRLVTYHLEIDEQNGKPSVAKEYLRYKRGEFGAPYHFIDFSHGKGYAVTEEDDFEKQVGDLARDEYTLDQDKLAIKGLGQFGKFLAAKELTSLLENWHVSDIHVQDTRDTKDATGFDEHLSESGDNLQLVARNYYDNFPEKFNQVVEAMTRRIPGVKKIEPLITQDQRLLLTFKDASFDEPFFHRWVSDGTIKMFAYLILLNDPNPHPLLSIEEPENQLYPQLLHDLAEEFRDYSRRGGQVFVSSHSPDFLNALETSEVFWLVKENGYTQIKRASDNEQIKAYMDSGDRLGRLWNQGFFDGADPQ
jgi:predicted ATPase